ncbi:hypothetical protein CCMA1212_004056 [Trichoderma ghanense]|uniref:SSCRP protein n=1 Tax=Trichoderma ghanense TaxID=65468 RepID=A0ABY2H8Y7_9HYPO
MRMKRQESANEIAEIGDMSKLGPWPSALLAVGLAWLGAGIQRAGPPGHGKGVEWKLSCLSAAAAAAAATTPFVVDQVMLFTAKPAYEPKGRLGFPAIPISSPRTDASSAAASIWASRRASRRASRERRSSTSTKFHVRDAFASDVVL